MYIRKAKFKKTVWLQIGKKEKGKFVLIKHIGSASTPAQMEILQLKAKEELNHLKFTNQLALFANTNTPIRAKLINWYITGYHQIFGHIYDLVGFPDGLLRDLVIARIVHPKSKASTVRYLDQYLGINFSEDKIYTGIRHIPNNGVTWM